VAKMPQFLYVIRDVDGAELFYAGRTLEDVGGDDGVEVAIYELSDVKIKRITETLVDRPREKKKRGAKRGR
jgi:hypothetical protein